MNPFAQEFHSQSLLASTRRQFLGRLSVGIGGAALASLLNQNILGAQPVDPMAAKMPHFPAKAKRAIYIHMAGSPSHLDLFDPKPKLVELNGKPCPDSLYKKERFAFIKGVPKMLGSPHKFKKYGRCEMELSELLPKIGGVADDICLVRSMHTDQFNHAPAQIF